MRKGSSIVVGLVLCALEGNAGAERVFQRLYSGFIDGHVVQGSDGIYYGTEVGTEMVFQLNPDGTIHPIARMPGLNAELTLADDGNIYGTTKTGGFSGYGTVFQISPGGQVVSFYSFDTNSPTPTG